MRFRTFIAILVGVVCIERGPTMLMGMPAHATVNIAQEANAIASCIEAGESPEECGELPPMDNL